MPRFKTWAFLCKESAGIPLPIVPDSWKDRDDFRRGSRWVIALLLAITLGNGTAERIETTRAYMDSEIWSDARDYLEPAEQMRFSEVYAPRFQEPGFVVTTKIFGTALGFKPSTIHIESCVFSIVLILVAFWAGSRFFGPWIGLLSAHLVSSNDLYRSMSAEGVRLELYSILVLVYAVLLFAPYHERFRTWRMIVLGMVGGALSLVRIVGLCIVVPSLIWAVFSKPGDQEKRRFVKPALLSFFVTTLIVSPYLWSCWTAFGDPLYSITVDAAWFAHAEGRRSEDSSALHFLFHDRSVSSIALGHLEGYWRIWNVWNTRTNYRWSTAVACLASLGWLVACCRPNVRWMCVVTVFGLLPVALSASITEVPRLYFHTYPFHAMCIGLGLNLVLFSAIRIWKHLLYRPARR
jgi:hypothetical protein